MMMNHLVRRGLLLAAVVWAGLAAQAEDWPTYQHDIARSAVTSEEVRPPLAELWAFRARHRPEPAWSPPKPVPVEGILELPRVHFDDVFHVAVAGGLAFFGSSADNKVYALDVAMGRLRWSAFTGGPVRLAPTVWKDRVLVGSDDGFVYCLRAADGAEVWKFQAALDERKVLGHGRMISLYPVRTGVLVDGGIAYFGAGIFPSEGVCLYAVRAEDGRVLWQNDYAAEGTRSSISPQGYLLASPNTLFAPMGRVSPAAFNRADGRFLYFAYFGKRIGGTYALLADDYLYTGTEEMIAHHQETRGRFAWFPGRRLIVTKGTSYMLTDREMAALDRKLYPKASMDRQRVLGQRGRLNRPLGSARRNRNSRDTAVKKTRRQLDAVEKKLAAVAKTAKPEDTRLAALQAQRDTLTKKLGKETDALNAATAALKKLESNLKTLNEKLKKANERVKSAFRWRSPCDCSDSMILAGGVVFAGGKNKAVGVDAATGKPIWTARVDGKARGLAAAAGRLFVSTDKGVIHCFGKQGQPVAGTVEQPPSPSSFSRDALTPVYEAAADAIVKATRIRRGYCLVLGCGSGRLACELAKRTELMIYGVDPDPKKVAAARKALDAAGLYGKRASVERAALSSVPYADYFANLIVSESALVSGEPPGDAAEMFRMLKPLGGVAYIGQPAEAAGKVKELTRSALRRWLRAAPIRDWRTLRADGLWARVERGALEGAGGWTHQYAEPGNTACGDDQIVRCPLGILWFGEPGPGKMANRHAGAAAPLSRDGRLFVQGENVLMAYDAYNGLKLWERKIEGAMRTRVSREAGNLALGEDSLFVAVGDKCLRLDVATGQTKATYRLPPSPDGKPRRWGYVATVGDLLYGSTMARGYVCDRLFAVDIRTGERRWIHDGKSISHITIAIGGGRVYFAEAEITAEQRKEALKEKLDELEGLKGKELQDARSRLRGADVRLVVALDATTGRLRWHRPIEVTDCRRISAGGGELICMYHDGILVFCAASTNGHFWRQFLGGEFARRTVVALSARSGRLLWAKAIGYRHRPLIIGDTLITEPWAFELRTGRLKMRTSPLTGEESPWQFARPGHHCGNVVACPTTLFFRSFTIGYYDLVGDYGTEHFGAQRPGCWINTIPANGLVLAPEASSGCMCPFPNMCTVVFQPRKENRAWAMYSVFQRGKQHRTWGESNIAKSLPPSRPPASRLAINLGAPGDRKDGEGTLWLSYPRPGGWLVFQYKMAASVLPKCGYYKQNPRRPRIQGTDRPWVFASGCRGLTRCVLPLVGKEQQPGIYTVRLGFVEPDNDRPGQRVFDVKLQGEVVLENFDIFSAAGGRNVALLGQFEGIQVDRALAIELVPKGGDETRQRVPILNSIEVMRIKALRVSARPPSFLLSDLKPQQSRELKITNHSDERFVGRLRVESVGGITAEPSSIRVRLAPKEGKTFTLRVAAAKGTEAGRYRIPLRLLSGLWGRLESENFAVVDHLGSKRVAAFTAVEDAFVRKQTPTRNFGSDERLWVDGGEKKMGDFSHCLAYFKFRLDIPGKPKSARVRLHVGTWPAAESGDSGRICLVKGEWHESTLTYQNQPKLGQEVAKIGRVGQGAVVERELKIALEGKKEISIALVPTGCDGCGYCSRETAKPAELIVEFGE